MDALPFSYTNSTTVAISGAAASSSASGDTDGTTMLAPITIEGTSEGINGYAASRVSNVVAAANLFQPRE